MFVLSMDVYEQRPHSFHLGQGAGLPVDPVCAPLPGQTSRQPDLTFLRMDVHPLQRLVYPGILHLESQLHQGVVRVLPDHLPGHLPAQSQLYRSKEDGLAGPGLPGQDIETRLKLHLLLPYQG